MERLSRSCVIGAKLRVDSTDNSCLQSLISNVSCVPVLENETRWHDGYDDLRLGIFSVVFNGFDRRALTVLRICID